MWIMTFIAEYFSDISTAQYEDAANILWLCLKHPESSFVFYLLTHHVTSY